MRLGIVGGLGPETGCSFCLNINNKFREMTSCQPDIVLENIPVPEEVERDIITGKENPEMLRLISKAVKGLNRAGADLIVIPCNSVHVFFDRLRKASGKPMLSIIEVCAEECRRRKLKKVGLLASTLSVKEGLHKKELDNAGIGLVLPSDKDQEKLSEIIIRIVRDKWTEEDRRKLIRIIGKMIRKGAEAVILGCTDLQMLVTSEFVDIPLIDTLDVLENEVIRKLFISDKANNKHAKGSIKTPQGIRCKEVL